MPAAEKAVFEFCARLAAGGRDGGLKRGGYNSRRRLSALKRDKQFANLWKTQKHLKDINENGLGFFFSLQKESVMRSMKR